MKHTITKTEDGNEDTCLTCGQVGSLSAECPQGIVIKEVKKNLED